MNYAELREPVVAATERAGRLAQRMRREGLAIEIKPDGSIVTPADRALEQLLRRDIEDLMPGLPVWGEEMGYAEPSEHGLWLVDPIDGTSNYAFGMGLWGVSVGLLVGSEIVFGCVFLPDADEMFVAWQGGGAWLNGSRLPAIRPGPIADHELVSFSDGIMRRLEGRRIPGKMRHLGSFVVSGAYLATGRLRALIGHKAKLYDVAGSVALVQEVGMEIRDSQGEPMNWGQQTRDEPIDRIYVIGPAGCQLF